MNRVMITLALLSACQTESWEADTALPGDAIAPPALSHTVSDLAPGETARFVVDGASYGERVFLLFHQGDLDGPVACPPQLGGGCLELPSPARVIGSAMADATGRAVVEVAVPEQVALDTQVSTQAVVVRGLGGAYSVTSPARTDVVTEPSETLRWSLSGLSALGEDYVYENWLIVDGQPLSAGRFRIDETGAADLDAFSFTADEAARATAFIITIEPAVGDDPAPSDTHVLAGDLMEGTAELEVSHPAALGTDFLSATGAYFLQTPSSADVEDDYAQGVWFMDPAVGGPSLDLPELPLGWAYEGWVVLDGVPYSTGKFVDPGDADWDGGGPTAGPDATPPVPGQDFIMPPMDLRGGAVVISVEPEPDDSAAPFALKPLIDGSVEDFGPGVLQGLSNMAMDTNPTGVAWFE